ncbi:MAG: protein translocase subunit SecF [Phototrophicaceae bacterium]|jgi:preprotein translocase SecF subunit
MFQLVQHRRYYFLLSTLVIGIGLAIMGYSFVQTGSPFILSIDFAGGNIYELQFSEAIEESTLREVFAKYGEDNIIVQRIGDLEENRWSIRSGFLPDNESISLVTDLEDNYNLIPQTTSSEFVSPTIGAEVTRSAFLAVAVASLVVTVFIVLAFRKIPNAFRYGICAVVAMLHDVLVMLGAVSLGGILFGWEVDALFLSAVLTVVGFSVQDSIVMFDRIRENIPKHLGEPYETIVNRSVLETIHRSLATQLNAFFVMVAILLFGGPSVKPFIAVLFIGLVSGTYSSIFNAVPLLVAWEKGEIPFLKGGYPTLAAESD